MTTDSATTEPRTERSGRILLHIGTHKTGTTSIQQFLWKNRNAIQQQGVLYPSYDIVGLKNHYAHLGIANALSNEHHLYSRDDALRFFAEVRHRARDHDITLISAEPFYRQLTEPCAPHALSPEEYWDKKDEYVRMISNLLPEAEIVIVLRRQASFVQSMYQEQVKKTLYNGRFRAYLDRSRHLTDYLKNVSIWKRHFQGLSVLSFEQLVKQDSIERAFCESVGIKAAQLSDAGVHNKGMLVDEVIVKRIINSFADSNEEALSLLDEIRTPNFLAALERLGRRSFFSSSAHLEEFEDAHMADNETLCDLISADDTLRQNLCTRSVIERVRYSDRLPEPVLQCTLSQFLGKAPRGRWPA